MYRLRVTILYLSIILAFLVGSASADSRFYYVDGNGDGIVTVDIDYNPNGNSGNYEFGYVDGTTFMLQSPLENVSYDNGDIINYAVQKTMGNSRTVKIVDLLSFDDLVTYSNGIKFGETTIYQTAVINWGSCFGTTTFTMDNALSSSDGMKPIPIPGSALLLGSGVLCLVVIGRRRRTKKA